jgi:hypothetical protein
VTASVEEAAAAVLVAFHGAQVSEEVDWKKIPDAELDPADSVGAIESTVILDADSVLVALAAVCETEV